jgi:hypothetical protein
MFIMDSLLDESRSYQAKVIAADIEQRRIVRENGFTEYITFRYADVARIMNSLNNEMDNIFTVLEKTTSICMLCFTEKDKIEKQTLITVAAHEGLA